MRAIKRFTLQVTYWWLDKLYVDELTSTSDLNTLMHIWDPFFDASHVRLNDVVRHLEPYGHAA